MKIHDDVLVLGASKKMPLMRIAVMSTAIRTSRGVVLIAPGAKIKEQERDLEALGRVTDVVAPNLFHHESIHLAQRTFPQATVWGVEGFRKKRPDVEWDKVLTPATWSYRDEIEIVEVKGTKLNEIVFFHPKSKTLVVTDLFFNVRHPKGFGAWLFLKTFGTYDRFALSRLYLRAVTDREAFKDSLREIAKLDFKQIVVSHGEPLVENARACFERALRERDLL